MVKAISAQVAALWERTIAPKPQVQEPGQRRRSRLLASQLLVLISLVFVGAVIQIFSAENFLEILPAISVGWLITFIGFHLARLGRYQLAAFLVATMIIIVCTLVVILRPSDPVWAGFLNLAVLFASMFVATRMLTVIAGMALFATAFGLFLTPELQVADEMVPLFFYQLIALLLIVLARAHHTALENERLAHERVAQERIAAAQRVELFGRLAGGVAHDFNNVLQLMSSSAILLESSDSLEREDREVVSELLATSQRASVMTKDLMMFAKEQSHPGAEIELNTWLRQALASLESGAPTEISLTYRAECEAASISAHPGQIRQVVENLVNNAAYASKSSSEVELLLSHTQLTPNEAKSLGCKPGPYARLLVKDQGIGMSAETLGRVFEPFFSTRGTTKGTGLGLAGVWAIIQQQEGHISAESQQQQGSVFKVLWPLLP